jgi:flagellar assembly factor FliW
MIAVDLPVRPASRSVMPDIPVIELVQPMPGFPDRSQFALVQLDDDGVLCQLRSLEDPNLRFLVVSPVSFFPDYSPVVDEDTVADLGIESVEDVLVLLVLTAGSSLSDTTANLAAPVLVNTTTRRAQQVILDDPQLSVATPLVA